MENNLGYCCINTALAGAGITTNRGMVKKTFLEKGILYASELAIKNIDSLIKILEWNSQNDIKMFRMSSDIFPWCSEYEIKDLPNFIIIKQKLERAGKISIDTGQRLSFHPSHFTVLASTNPEVVKKSIKDLNQHSEIMDLMGLAENTYYPINIHVGTTQPTKIDAAKRFCENYKLLHSSTQKRLVVENDDKKAGFTPNDLYQNIHLDIGIPITFDYHHYQCNPDPLSESYALKQCLRTWKTKALTHYSDSRRKYEDLEAKEVAHSDWIWNERIPIYDQEFDIELEVKMKEQALLKYRKKLIYQANK